MQEVRGPAYTAPVFQHVQLSAEAIRAPAPGGFHHDIIQMTQPSQQMSQDPTQPSLFASSSEKIGVRRAPQDKWEINKRLSREKMETIRRDWGWGSGLPPRVRIRHDLMFDLEANAMQSLEPGAWIDDRIIYAYMVHSLTLLAFRICCAFIL